VYRGRAEKTSLSGGKTNTGSEGRSEKEGLSDEVWEQRGEAKIARRLRRRGATAWGKKGLSTREDLFDLWWKWPICVVCAATCLKTGASDWQRALPHPYRGIGQEAIKKIKKTLKRKDY